jgi:hypothetical protein
LDPDPCPPDTFGLKSEIENPERRSFWRNPSWVLDGKSEIRNPKSEIKRSPYEPIPEGLPEGEN